MKKNEGEIWKDVVGYEKLYQISNLGRVKSLAKSWITGKGKFTRKKEDTILHYRNLKGYHIVTLYNGKTRNHYYIHRLVLKAFIGESNLDCNHINSDKSCNKLENLEYVTHEDNIRHATKCGLIKKGEEHFFSRLTEAQVIRIKTINKNMKPEKGYWIKVAKSLKVSRHTIYGINSNTWWKHIQV